MKLSNEPVVITCALSGAGSREGMPQIPATPKAFAEEARRAYDAGASIVHLHARDPLTGLPSHKVEHFADIVEAIRAAAPELIINVTTGGGLGLTPEERVAPALSVKADFGTISMGSLNLAAYSREDKSFRYDLVFGNSFSTISYFLEKMVASSMRVDYEFYEAGHISNFGILSDQGLTAPGVFSLILGVDGAIAASVPNLMHMVQLLPKDGHWEVVSPGLQQWGLIAAALGHGGSVRVGFEDNAFVSQGVVARSNADLVDKVVRMAGDVGRPIASAAMTRKILGMV